MAEDTPPKPPLTEAEKAARRAKNAANRARREARAAEKAEKQKARAARRAKKQGKADPAKADGGGSGGKGKQGGKPGGKSKGGKQKEAGKAKGAQKANRQAKSGSADAPPATRIPLPPAIAWSPPPPPDPDVQTQPFNILVIAQRGRLEYEAALFAESLRANAPNWRGSLIVAEPRPDARWSGHKTEISAQTRAALESRGAEIAPFTARHFGADYPQGNKIEALSLLPANEPFLFFDSDTLITGQLDQLPFDFARPAASMKREGTWPQPPLYGPGYAEIWRSLYDRFGLDFDSSLDLSQPDEHWERYLYFNAGWFFGDDPAEFGRRYLDWAREVRDEPGDALACQVLDPWLDQVVLPLVIHSFGGGRPGPGLAGLDGDVTCHWRNLPLLYSRESDRVVDVLERAAAAPDLQELLRGWEPAFRLIQQGHGRNALRPMIDRETLPRNERPLRQQIKRAGWWLV